MEPRRLLTTFHVDADAPAGQDGSTWDAAFDDLQVALRAAREGDTIRVAGGVYKPTSGTDRAATFALRLGVKLLGGFAGTGAADPNRRDFDLHRSVLSGDIGAEGARGDNSYHVVEAVDVYPASVLDGFTITGGQADNDTVGWAMRGGGLLARFAHPTVRNCTFEDNYAFEGGAAYAGSNSRPTFEACTFRSNQAKDRGGAIRNEYACATITDCVFEFNSGGWAGGALYDYMDVKESTRITRCRFTGNSAGAGGAVNAGLNAIAISDSTFTGNTAVMGGAIHGHNTNSIHHWTIARSTFRNNSATDGGALSTHEFHFARITDCTFAGNRASGNGGVVSAFLSTSPTFVNCAFVDNDAGRNGGAIFSDYNTSVHLINCTLVGNRATGAGDSAGAGGALFNAANSHPRVTNSILWGNGGSPIYNNPFGPPSNPVVRFSLVEGGHTGTGNLHADPMIVRSPGPGPDGAWGTSDDQEGDPRPGPGSPAIDAGDNAAVPEGVARDLAGEPRFVDVPGIPDAGNGGPPIVDLGALEAQAPDTSPPLVVAAAFHPESAPFRLSFRFSEALSRPPTADDVSLRILGNPGGAEPLVLAHSYDPDTRTVTFSIASQSNGALPDGDYRATLSAGSASDGAGNLLPAAFDLDFFVLRGDANRDRTVDFADLVILAQNYGDAGKTFSQGNFNHDPAGNVDFEDLVLLAQRYGTTLAAPTPSPQVQRKPNDRVSNATLPVRKPASPAKPQNPARNV